MTGIDVCGHVAYLFLVAGMVLLTRKNLWGWACRFIGEIGWVVIGFIMGMTSIWLWGLVFMCIDIKGFYEWWKWEGQFNG